MQIRFTEDDIDLIRNTAPLVRRISRASEMDATLQAGDAFVQPSVERSDPGIPQIWALSLSSGRFINEEDEVSHAHVAVLASAAKDKLFSGMPALDDTVRINGVSFQVIGAAAAPHGRAGRQQRYNKLASTSRSPPWIRSRIRTIWMAFGWIWRAWIR